MVTPTTESAVKAARESNLVGSPFDPLSAYQLHRIPACTANACGQDSRNCRTPQACHVPEIDTGLDRKDALRAVAMALVTALLALACAVLPMIFDK